MSTGGENIYHLIPYDEQKHAKDKRYISKFKSSGGTDDSDACAQKKFAHRTMGEAHNAADPNEFLKKRTRDEKFAAETAKTCGQKCGKICDENCMSRRPAVPKQEEKPVMGIKTTKNFITQNAVENIMAVTKKPQKVGVDTRHGDKFLLEASGLEPVYVQKKEYGKVPEYLVRRQDEIQKAQAEYNCYINDMQRRGEMYQISCAERDSILEGLKKNWEELYHQYQSLSVVVDTVPKKHRKEFLENEMKNLERDIETMQKHSVIYVGN